MEDEAQPRPPADTGDLPYSADRPEINETSVTRPEVGGDPTESDLTAGGTGTSIGDGTDDIGGSGGAGGGVVDRIGGIGEVGGVSSGSVGGSITGSGVPPEPPEPTEESNSEVRKPRKREE